MRFRKVSVMLRPILGYIWPRLKPHFRLSNAALLLREAVALIRSMIALVWAREFKFVYNDSKNDSNDSKKL